MWWPVGDESLNAGLPLTGGSDCVVDDVQVEVMKRDGTIVATASQGSDAVSNANFPSWGARIASSGKGTSSIATAVHWWYDFGVAVRYQLHYYVTRASGQTCGAP